MQGAAAGAALLGLSLLGLGGAVVYALNNPSVICRGIEWGLEWPEGSIEVEDLVLTRDGLFTIDGLAIDPPLQRVPLVNVERVTGALPDPRRILSTGEIDLGDVVIAGAMIRQRVQRPPDSRPPPPKKPLTLVASSVIIDGGRFSAAPDPPFKAVDVRRVDGRLTGFRWTPALRRFDGVGKATVAQMEIGNIDLTDLEIPYLLLANGDLQLGMSSFYYGRTQGFADGAIRGLDGRPAVEIQVRLKGSRIETAVEDAMERASPVMGWLTAELTIHAGGELERGDSRFDGWVNLSDSYVFVGNDLKLIPKLLLDVAPWFKRDGGGWLRIGDLHGEATFGRGWVELGRMERVSNKHRVLQAWGSLRDGNVDMTVRAVPRNASKKPEKRGMGVRVRGPIASARIKLAKKEDLLDHPEVMVLD